MDIKKVCDELKEHTPWGVSHILIMFVFLIFYLKKAYLFLVPNR